MLWLEVDELIAIAGGADKIAARRISQGLRQAGGWKLLLSAPLSDGAAFPGGRGRRLVDQHIFALLAILDCCGHPPRQRTTAGSHFAVRSTVFGGDFPTFQAGSTCTASAASAGAECR